MDASSSPPITSATSSMAANTTHASVSSSSYWKYGVFLSFRGADTRNNFTGHLYKELDKKGIDTFMDDKKVRTGEEIPRTLVTAIQRSRCSIIVLSENYASSKWCLEELVEILECKRTKNQRVVPIFYNVDPSHVRNQTGSFGEALSKHEDNLKIKGEKVRKWREALTQVANLSGLHSLNKSEAQLIEEIVMDISKDLNFVPSKDTQILIGMDSCIRELKSLLHLGSPDVRMIGIWGMGGIGKTTIVRAIYDQISHKFEGCCFLANVGDLARKGEDYLKKQLLSRVLRDKNIDVTVTSLKARLHSKNVFIVIDNVNHRSILKTLAGEPNWFGPQSRIIITTRDKQFLTMHGVNAIYEVQKLPSDKAIELFNHHAFINDPPTGDVMELIHDVITYAQGLPLALEVLGSSLCNKNKDEWMCALNKLQKIPDMEIQKVLQISFDELDDDQKGIFLDIAFLFSGVNKDFVMEILNSCGFSSLSGIRTLIDKALISIIDGKIQMHDLLVEMGKEIVRQTSPKEPGKRSRLWMQQDICHVLEKYTGTEEVEVIAFELSGLKEIRFTTAAFAKMTKLKVLAIVSECSSDQMQCEVHISDDFKFHYDELRSLFWERYPLELLPSDFKSKNLVWLYMPNSHLTHVWEGNKVFENLQMMVLSDSKFLTETPDFSMVANLRALILDGCTQLRKIHSSLGDLDKLKVLNFKNCINLEHFPGLSGLVSLETLILSGCSKLEKFPGFSQHMPCLSKLRLDGTAITELPSSIGFATELVLLDLKNCRSLPALPALPSELKLLNASNCKSLEDISQSVLSFFGGSIFGNCFQLTKYESTMERNLRSMATQVDKERWRSTYEQQYPNVEVPLSTVFPGSRIPDWFKHRDEGHEINMKVSPNWCSSKFLGFALCAVMATKNDFLGRGWSTYCHLGSPDHNSKSESSYVCSFTDDRTRGLKHTKIGSDHLWLAYIPSFLGFNREKWSRIKFSFGTNRRSCIVKRCGICPVYIKTSGDNQHDSDDDDSYSDEGNPSGSVQKKPRSRASVQEDVNDSVLQGTIIISFDDADPRGIGYSRTNAHACDQDRFQLTPDPLIFQLSNAPYTPGMNPGRSGLDNLCERILEDTMTTRSLCEVLEDVQQSVLQDTIARRRSLGEGIGCFLTDSYAWYQERFERQPNPSTSNIEIGSWVFIAIFSFLFLAHIFHWAPFRISPLHAAPFGISTLVVGLVLLILILSRL